MSLGKLGYLLFLMLIIGKISAYEIVWTTHFETQEGYGYNGDSFNNSDNDWLIDSRGISFEDESQPDWFKVRRGVLQAKDLDCSYQLDDIGKGCIWKSEVINTDSNFEYYIDIEFENSDDCDVSITHNSSEEFIKCYYTDDTGLTHNFSTFYGYRGRNKLSGKVSGTDNCQICIELDCNSDDETYDLHKVTLYKITDSSNIEDLLISKLCAPDNYDRDERYIQISNLGQGLIDISDLKLEAIRDNINFYEWDLNGIILPSQSIIIGDLDFKNEYNKICKENWHSRNIGWDGADNDGAQIVSTRTREVIDRIVGVDFYEGYIERTSPIQSISETSDETNWNYFTAESATNSYPGEFEIETTLPVNLTNLNIIDNDVNRTLKWHSTNESEVLGYNILFSQTSIIDESVRINSSVIDVKASSLINEYSYNLRELCISGYIWVEIAYYNCANDYSDYIRYETNENEEQQENIVTPNTDLLRIFPNPVNVDSQIKINYGQESINFISIYNIRGQKLKEIEYTERKSKVGISSLLEDLQSGCYVLRIKVGREYINKKIVKVD